MHRADRGQRCLARWVAAGGLAVTGGVLTGAGPAGAQAAVNVPQSHVEVASVCLPGADWSVTLTVTNMDPYPARVTVAFAFAAQFVPVPFPSTPIESGQRAEVSVHVPRTGGEGLVRSEIVLDGVDTRHWSEGGGDQALHLGECPAPVPPPTPASTPVPPAPTTKATTAPAGPPTTQARTSTTTGTLPPSTEAPTTSSTVAPSTTTPGSMLPAAAGGPGPGGPSPNGGPAGEPDVSGLSVGLAVGALVVLPAGAAMLIEAVRRRASARLAARGNPVRSPLAAGPPPSR
jgi:hypothetical protein